MLAGTELKKPRRLSEVLTDSFSILFAHWRPLAIISVPVVIANIAFFLVLLAITQDLPATEELTSDGTDVIADEVLDALLLIVLASLVFMPIAFVLQQLVAGAVVEYLVENDRSSPLPPAEALDRAQANLGALVGATLRAYAIVVLLAITIVGLPWAVARAIRWIFLAQVIMVEGKRGQEVLARSAELVAGRWWNTLGRLLVVGLVVQIPAQFLQSALLEAAPGVIGTVLAGATGFVYVPFLIIGLSLMFFDLKARKAEDDVAGTPDGPAT